MIEVIFETHSTSVDNESGVASVVGGAHYYLRHFQEAEGEGSE